MSVRENFIAEELRRLAGCGDIPRYRRKQILRLALDLSPEPFAEPNAAPDMFHDGYYRRPGLRMKAVRESSETSAPRQPALLTAIASTGEPS